jgi:two-component system phosphate regulon sensor histidine kinase PhoR
VRAGEVVADEEIEIARQDGSHTTVSASAGPVRDEDGSIRAGVMTLTDVGARKEAEAIRDAFLGVISHELRTPITAIYGGARLLLRPESRLDIETRQAVLEDIAGESERLTRLIENTLVLARSERGEEAAAREPLLLQRVLPSIVAAEAAEHPGTRFEVHAPHELPAALGDVGYVDQVIRNLLSNAAKYGRKDGGVQVVVEPVEGEVRVRVLDDGPGIGGEDPHALFGLFYRSPRTIAAASGAGIGLFVVRHLVEAMGGRVWAVDRPEGGAEFGFALEILGENDPTA